MPALLLSASLSSAVLSGAMLLGAMLLSACSREPSADAARANDVAASASPRRHAPAAPSVTIGGQDAAETVTRWQPPPVELADTGVAQARTRAAQALADGHLFEDADAAIPLYLAIRQLHPDDAAARRGLLQARRMLVERGNALLQQESTDAGLQQAAAIALVAISLAPDDQRAHRLQQRVETAQRVLAFDIAGEDDLREGRLGEDGDGALPNFREALALAPEDVRSKQGMAAVESALIARAEAAAHATDFDTARRWLADAAKVREDAPSVADARARVQAIRSARIAGLHEAGLRDLTEPAGLRAARVKLAEVLRIADPGDAVAAQLRERVELATHYGSFRPGQVFTDGMRDGGRGPQMIVVPHGAFTMGAGDNEAGAKDAERPAHYVRFERGFALSITEVTVAQFRRFVEAAGARPRASRRGHSTVYDERSGNFIRRSGVDWQSGYNGARAAPGDPVMHVSVRDAEAYATWLSEQTGRHYHLPSEAEFEYALRAGGTGRYPWGAAAPPPPRSGNYTGSEDASPGGRHWSNGFAGYGDGYWGPAPVGSFRASAWGLHDIGGNLSEWVADCWHASYRRAPADGVAWYNPGCRQRVVRGGSWANSPEQTRAAWRLSQDSDMTSARIGFRLARGI